MKEHVTLDGKDGRDKLVSLLRRMIREIEADWTPPFLCVVYPQMDGGIETFVGFTSGDVRHAKMFSEILDEAKGSFEKEFILNMVGLKEKDVDEAAEQFRRDIEKAKARAQDRLKPDIPITNLKDAQRLLQKIMANMEKDKDHDS